ncbi:hypothetical protein [uncultured Campylobacter sp.]|uniref:hypothetical protein n=1 Tax=uncultured Campylobacter sp. TaxID=218934 RepID=UPI00260C00E7|nr:hypothetical protein [uncultured Campylobacter sp.]
MRSRNFPTPISNIAGILNLFPTNGTAINLNVWRESKKCIVKRRSKKRPLNFRGKRAKFKGAQIDL